MREGIRARRRATPGATVSGWVPPQRQLPTYAVGPTFSARRDQIVLGSERQSTQTRSGCEDLEVGFARGDRADDGLRDGDTGWAGKRRHQPGDDRPGFEHQA